MSKEKDFYLARGRSLEAVREHQAASVAYVEELLSLLPEYGIQVDPKNTRFFLGLGGFVGWPLPIDQPVPPGWVRDRLSRDMICPDRSRKKENIVGKALRKALEELPKYPNEISLCHALCGEPFAWSGSAPKGSFGRSVGYYTYEELGGEFVLSVMSGGKAPYDAEPLLRSAYWKMKEDSSKSSVAVGA